MMMIEMSVKMKTTNEDHIVMTQPNFFSVHFGSLTLHPWALDDAVVGG